MVDVKEPVAFEVLSEEIQELLRKAVDARKMSYCPYSNFAVGAALLSSEDGAVVTGCNVESYTFSPTICAERTAIAKAVSEGKRKFSAVAVIANQKTTFTSPCGVCRQVLVEFSDVDMDVYLSRPQLDGVLSLKLSELLPYCFVNFKNDNGDDL